MGRVLILIWMLGISLVVVAQNSNSPVGSASKLNKSKIPNELKKSFPKHTLVFTVYDSKFASDVSVLNDELDNIVSVLKEQPSAGVYVYGYTDNTGTYEVNQKVSLQRAEAVAKTLKEKGVDEGRITTKGMSYDYPIADNSTAEGRAKNRRVEVYIVPK